MEQYTGTVPTGSRYYNVDYDKLWALLNTGPVKLSVGTDFTDSSQCARFQAAIYCGPIKRRAKATNHRIRTRTINDDLIVWLEPTTQS